MKNRDIEVAKETMVNLMECTREALESLPSGLVVGGILDLGWCTKLETLPHGLKVGRDLDLLGCENLGSLPFGLVVAGDLDLGWCRKLMGLPRDLQVAGTIYYNDKTGFALDEEKLRELQVRFPEKLKKY